MERAAPPGVSGSPAPPSAQRRAPVGIERDLTLPGGRIDERIFSGLRWGRNQGRTDWPDMGRTINKLSARQVEKAVKPGRYSDGGNLYLSIAKNGGKRWVFLYRFGGRQREMGLGSASGSGATLNTPPNGR